MKEKSLIWTVLAFIFAVVGYIAHLAAIGTGRDMMNICILSLVYISPLLFDAIEAVDQIEACTKEQHFIDKSVVVVGIILFLAIFILFVLKASFSNFQISGIWEILLKGVFTILPVTFVIRSFYNLKIKWKQNANIAQVYFRKRDIKF